jgi:hypothetical protein
MGTNPSVGKQRSPFRAVQFARNSLQLRFAGRGRRCAAHVQRAQCCHSSIGELARIIGYSGFTDCIRNICRGLK